MITVELDKGFAFTMYDDAEQLPANLYKDHQKLSLKDCGIGSSMDDVAARFDTMFKFIAANKTKELRGEVENLYYTHYSMLEEINYQHLSFAIMVKEVQGVEVKDRDENTLNALIKTLSENGLTQAILKEKLDFVKKKSEAS